MGGKLIVKPVLHLWVYFLKCFPNKIMKDGYL